MGKLNGDVTDEGRHIVDALIQFFVEEMAEARNALVDGLLRPLKFSIGRSIGAYAGGVTDDTDELVVLGRVFGGGGFL